MAKDVRRGLESALGCMVSRDVVPHEAERRADAETVAWAKRFKLASGAVALRKVAGIRAGSCAAHTFPHADERVILLGARLIAWLFLFDDEYGEGPHAPDARDLIATLGTYSRLIRTGLMPIERTPFHAALLDIRTEALALSQSEDWLHRFADSFECYVGGCVMEYYARDSAKAPDLDEYRRLRAWSIGTFPVFDLIELPNQLLSLEEAQRADLARLRERAALLCAWANDIHSFGKESAAGDGMNLVAVLEREYGLDADDAFGAAAEVFNTDLALFEDEKARLLALESSGLAQYASGLQDWIFGNLQWTALCRRYHAEARAVS